MLTIGKEQIQTINPDAEVHLFGQEVNPQTFAMCKSDLYMKSTDGRDADNIAFGSTLSNDGHAEKDIRLPARQSTLRLRLEPRSRRSPQGSRSGQPQPIRGRIAADQ